MQSVLGAPPGLSVPSSKEDMLSPPGLESLLDLKQTSVCFRAPPGLTHPSEEEALETMNSFQMPCQGAWACAPRPGLILEDKLAQSDNDDDDTHAGSALSESEVSDSDTSSRRSSSSGLAKLHAEAPAFLPKASFKFSSEIAEFIPSFTPEVSRTKLTSTAAAFVPRLVPVYLDRQPPTAQATNVAPPPPGLRSKLNSVAPSFKPRVAV